MSRTRIGAPLKISGRLARRPKRIAVRKANGFDRLLADAQRLRASLGEEAGHEPLTLGDALDLDGDRVHRLLESLHALLGFGGPGGGRVTRSAPPDVARHCDGHWEENEDRADYRDRGD